MVKRNFQYNRIEAKSNDNEVFRLAANNDHLKILVWLKDTFNIIEKYPKAYQISAFRLAAYNGHLNGLGFLKPRQCIKRYF
jgi:hypothetical protein